MLFEQPSKKFTCSLRVESLQPHSGGGASLKGATWHSEISEQRSSTGPSGL